MNGIMNVQMHMRASGMLNFLSEECPIADLKQGTPKLLLTTKVQQQSNL